MRRPDGKSICENLCESVAHFTIAASTTPEITMFAIVSGMNTFQPSAMS